MVRLPITWAAFADALAPLDQKIYASHDPKKDTVIAAGVNFKGRLFLYPKDVEGDFISLISRGE